MTTTEPSAEALLLAEIRFAIDAQFDENRDDGVIEARDLMTSIEEHLRETGALNRFTDAAYRRGIRDAAKIADDAWQQPPHPRLTEHRAIALRIRALAPPQG